jgi:hypothetical protein
VEEDNMGPKGNNKGEVGIVDIGMGMYKDMDMDRDMKVAGDIGHSPNLVVVLDVHNDIDPDSLFSVLSPLGGILILI